MPQLTMPIPDDDSYRNVLEPLRPPEAEIAFHDGLTGLYNFRFLEQLLVERWNELLALSDRFAIVILDLDLFKDVNDRYGHLSGDEVLRETGRILRRDFRGGDFVFRYGGDEFVVLLPGADANEAAALGERARTAMLEAEFVSPEEQLRIEIPVSFSIGVAAYPADGESGKSVLARADERLYHEKQALRRGIRRRRVLISGAAIALVGAIALGLFLTLPVRTPEAVLLPPGASSPANVASRAASAEEERLLLARIAELQEEIERLTRERTGQTVPDAGNRTEDIQTLQSQVRELTDRLEARSAGAAAATTDVSRQSGDTSGSERPSTESEPQERPAESAPASTGSPSERIVTAPPRLLEPVTPKYPTIARDRRLEATIEFRVLIDESGRVVNATPVGPPKGFGFDEAARAAAFASRWTAGTRAGLPAPMETTLLVNFRIRG